MWGERFGISAKKYNKRGVFEMTRKLILMGLVLFLAVSLAACGGGDQSSGTNAPETPEDDAASFYKGKNITWIIPYNPGGGYDAYTRVIAPYFEKYTGATVVCKNEPGAGSLIGTNKLYQSKPDGLTVGILNGPGVTQAQLSNDPGVQFDLQKFNWLGRICFEPRLVVVGSHTPYQSLEEMLNGNKKVRFGAPGTGSQTFMESIMAAEALGLDMEMITGYETQADAQMAIIRKELDATSGSYSSLYDQIKNGDLRPLAVIANERAAEVPDLPIVKEVPGVSDEGKQLLDIAIAINEVGRAVAAPEGVPEERLQFLRDAFSKALAEPELLDIAKQQELIISPLTGTELKEIIDSGLNMSEEARQKMTTALGKYK